MASVSAVPPKRPRGLHDAVNGVIIFPPACHISSMINWISMRFHAVFGIHPHALNVVQVCASALNEQSINQWCQIGCLPRDDKPDHFRSILPTLTSTFCIFYTSTGSALIYTQASYTYLLTCVTQKRLQSDSRH